MTMKTQTKGEYRVGTTFNPSGHEAVNKIKRAAADLIDLIEQEVPMESVDTTEKSHQQAEIFRLKALAQTAVENAAMWAVKAATKQAPATV